MNLRIVYQTKQVKINQNQIVKILKINLQNQIQLIKNPMNKI
jgi:hypothetical protein